MEGTKYYSVLLIVEPYLVPIDNMEPILLPVPGCQFVQRIMRPDNHRSFITVIQEDIPWRCVEWNYSSGPLCSVTLDKCPWYRTRTPLWWLTAPPPGKRYGQKDAWYAHKLAWSRHCQGRNNPSSGVRRLLWSSAGTPSFGRGCQRTPHECTPVIVMVNTEYRTTYYIILDDAQYFVMFKILRGHPVFRS